MRFVNIHEAKTHFSKLVNCALQGEEITIAMAGKPIATLGPIKKKSQRTFGVLKGKVKITKDFDAPLPEHLISEFED